MKTLSASIAALFLLTGAAFAQTAPKAEGDPIAQKFASLDADKSGFLDGKELDVFKDKMTMLDMDKDGKVSASEYNMGVMTGVVAR